MRVVTKKYFVCREVQCQFRKTNLINIIDMSEEKENLTRVLNLITFLLFLP